MKYTVIIPFYKAYPFFHHTLASVLSQTLPPAEVLVIDDEATSASREFLMEFHSGIVQVIPLFANSGVANARNVGIGAARYEWVAFQDADDIWEPEKMQRQSEYLGSNLEWVGCHTGIRVFNQDGAITASYLNKPSELRIDDLLSGSHVTPSSLVIRRDALLALGGMNTIFTTSEDYDFSIRLVKAGYKLGFVPLPLVRFRRQQQGNLSSNWHKTLLNHIRIVWIHRDMFISYKGPHIARLFLAQSLRESSGKLGGRRGWCLYQIGKLLGITRQSQ